MARLRVFIWLLMLIGASLACSLANISGEDRSGEPAGVDTTGWVAFVGQNVEIGAPPSDWMLIPFNLSVALEQQAVLNEQYPTVANVYRDLVLRFARDDDSRLILMKTDGTAWVVVKRESLVGTSFNERVTTMKTSQSASGTAPYDQESVTIQGYNGQRWKLDYSPEGSQVVHQQWYYALPIGENMYIIIFNAQSADFIAYQPVFEGMVTTFNPPVP